MRSTTTMSVALSAICCTWQALRMRTIWKKLCLRCRCANLSASDLIWTTRKHRSRRSCSRLSNSRWQSRQSTFASSGPRSENTISRTSTLSTLSVTSSQSGSLNSRMRLMRIATKKYKTRFRKMCTHLLMSQAYLMSFARSTSKKRKLSGVKILPASWSMVDSKMT